MVKKVRIFPDFFPFQGPFVAAFASANLGDVSPNIKGAKCIDTGKDCDLYQSTCEGRTQNCIAFGPGNTMKESTYIIGDRQFQEAKVSGYKDPKISFFILARTNSTIRG